MVQVDALDWFTETVPAATDLFLRTAKSVGAAVEVYPHPDTDPDGRPLACATARMGRPDASRVLIIVSGTHGIEGHCGAAIQSAYLTRLAQSGLPDATALLAVHLVNPWGCAWNRRENEDNVDIFRNLIFTGPDFPSNPLYDAYEGAINPRAWDGPVREAADRLYRKFIETHGMEAVISTIRRGQHNHPKGMTFNGNGLTWSLETVRAIGQRELRQGQQADVVDIHTGFGSFAEAIVIPCAPAGSPGFDRVEQHFPDIIYRWGSDVALPRQDRGPYDIWEEVVGAGNVNNFGLEFGTYNLADRIEVIRANTFIHTYGDPQSDFGQQTSAEYRELFYPASADWRRRTLATGLEVLDRSLKL